MRLPCPPRSRCQPHHPGGEPRQHEPEKPSSPEAPPGSANSETSPRKNIWANPPIIDRKIRFSKTTRLRPVRRHGLIRARSRASSSTFRPALPPPRTACLRPRPLPNRSRKPGNRVVNRLTLHHRRSRLRRSDLHPPSSRPPPPRRPRPRSVRALQHPERPVRHLHRVRALGTPQPAPRRDTRHIQNRPTPRTAHLVLHRLSHAQGPRLRFMKTPPNRPVIISRPTPPSHPAKQRPP